MKRRVIVYWLMPARPEADLFRDIIRILAAQFDAPRFEPHLTLCQPPGSVSSRKALHQIRFAPVRLRFVGIEQSAKFTQTLIVRFAPNKSLDRIVGALGGSPPLHNPHLSLIYKKMQVSTRRGLALAIQLPFRHVTFDRIQAVSCVMPTETRQDVRSWRALATRRLVR